jgi:hypothetical protein
VEETHGDGGDPVDAALLVLAAHAEVLLDFLGDFGDGWDHSGQLGCGFYWSFFDRANGSHVFSVSSDCFNYHLRTAVFNANRRV